jgi:DNA-binding transcriptional MerR regulator
MNSDHREPPKPLASNGLHDLVKIGDFARLANTNLRTLRYYEEIGLLQPATRSTGGFRFYRREDLDRLRMVNRLQELGLELARIRELMVTRGNGLAHREFVARVRQALTEQAQLIEARITSLGQQQKGLEEALAKLEECTPCNLHPAAENNFCHPCQIDGKALPVELSALF